MLCTDREQLAYTIRCDAGYTRDWMDNFTDRPDDPSRPVIIEAAGRYLAWCATANSELLTNPDADAAEYEAAWRRQAVASHVVVRPYDIASGLASLLLASSALIAFVFGAWPVMTAALLAPRWASGKPNTS